MCKRTEQQRTSSSSNTLTVTSGIAPPPSQITTAIATEPKSTTLRRPIYFSQIARLCESPRHTAPAFHISNKSRASRLLSLSVGAWDDLRARWADIVANLSQFFSLWAFTYRNEFGLCPSLHPGTLRTNSPLVFLSRLVSSNHHVLDRRVGFAGGQFGKGARSARSGFGIYYNQVQAPVNKRQLISPPFTVRKDILIPAQPSRPSSDEISPSRAN